MPEGIEFTIPTGYGHIRELIAFEEWGVLKHGRVNIKDKRLIFTIQLEQTEWDRNYMLTIIKARLDDNVHDIARGCVNDQVIDSGTHILGSGAST